MPFEANTPMWLPPLTGFQVPSALPADILGVIDASTLEPLVDSKSLLWAKDIATQYAVPARMLCCECRLSEAESAVDLALCLGPDFAQYLRTAAREALLCGRPYERFLRAWTRPDGDLLEQVPFVCLAFDSNSPDAKSPCLSVCIERDFAAKSYGMSGGPVDVASRQDLVERCYELAQGEQMPLRAQAVLGRYLRAQPRVEFRHVSFMHARSPAAFKLDIRLPSADVPRYLEQVQWPHPLPGLEVALASLARPDAKVHLNLTLEPLTHSVLEVEFVPSSIVGDLEGRLIALDNLVRVGICDASKAKVLERTLRSPLVVGAPRDRVALNHYVKVRFFSDGSVDAKAYLALIPQFPRAPHNGVTLAARASGGADAR